MGNLENAMRGNDRESRDFGVTKITKNDPILKDRKVITIDRCVSVDVNHPNSFLAFGDVDKRKPGLFWSHSADQPFVDYVTGIIAIDAKNPAALMQYCFDFFENKNADVAADAFQEFSRSDDRDI